MDRQQEVLRKYRANKNLQALVDLGYCLIKYVLFKSGNEDFIYMGGQAIVEEDLKSNLSINSFDRKSGGSDFFMKSFNK